MGGEYTYLIGLLIFGAVLGTAGLIAAHRERRERLGHTSGRAQLPIPFERHRDHVAAG